MDIPICGRSGENSNRTQLYEFMLKILVLDFIQNVCKLYEKFGKIN